MAGDVEVFLFTSRNERFRHIEIKTLNNYGEENACYLSILSMVCKGWFSLAHKHKHKPTYAEAVRS